ncbi:MULTISPECIES: RodZ domain-containing protein [unclassified Virgibacillus]|uniref:helix-turn-helix domain-containing protein n=1 Tax=unclassified Virgibacillus TaxID=2620237 RepID=UPI0024DE6CC6|nr:RodZ domain-containing protein [Virgibacillus sp. LDC-1]
MGIGARLKEAREQKDISLDSLQETTKIQKRYLVAIEEENFRILPGKFYARAFIKEYAAAVGLNAQELMDEYKDDIPSPEEDRDTEYTHIQRSRKDHRPTKSNAIFSLIPTIIVVVLIIGIVFAAWFFVQKAVGSDGGEPIEKDNGNDEVYRQEDTSANDQTENTDEADSETESSDSTESNDQSTDTSEETSELTLVEEGTGSVPESTFELRNPGEKVIVTLEASGNTWLDVNNGDGKAFYSNNFASDQSPLEIDITGEEKVFFKVGSAPDLTIKINGVELTYPVDVNENVFQKIWVNILSENE